MTMRVVSAALLVWGAAWPLAAQQASAAAPRAREMRRVMVREDTGTMKVTVMIDGIDSLVKALVHSRQLEERIGIALREYGGAPTNEARKRALEEQLAKIARNNVSLMSQIQLACAKGNWGPRPQQPAGYLGVSFSGSFEVRSDNNEPEVFFFREPPEIVSVEPGGPADKAGVHTGDRLLALDGNEVAGRDLVMAKFLVPGRKLPVKVERDGKPVTFKVAIEKRPENFGSQCENIELVMSPQSAMPAMAPMPPMAPTVTRGFTYVRPTPKTPTTPDAPSTPSPVSPANPPSVNVWTYEAPPPIAISSFSAIVAGAQLMTLTDDFKELTGADRGVMIQRVVGDSPAASAGLRGGDVIVEAGDQEVTNPRMLQRMIGENEAHNLKLKVVRKGKARTVWLKW